MKTHLAPWHTLYLVHLESGKALSTRDSAGAREAVEDLRTHGGMAGWIGPFAALEEAERFEGDLSPEALDAACAEGLDVDQIDWADPVDPR